MIVSARYLLLCSAVLLASCTYTERAPEIDGQKLRATIGEPESGEESTQTDEKSPPLNPGVTPKKNIEPDTKVTFNQDIYPLLSSKEVGRVYGCTTCHHGYSDYQTVATPEKVAVILSRASPGGGMPEQGDSFSEKDIQMIRDWMAQGFPE